MILTAEDAEIRRGPQRKPQTIQILDNFLIYRYLELYFKPDLSKTRVEARPPIVSKHANEGSFVC